MATAYTTDILRYEKLMKINQVKLLNVSGDQVNVSEDFIRYREEVKQLIDKSSYIGVNRKINLAKRFELTGNLEFAARLHKTILAQNTRAFESLYSLSRIYRVLGKESEADKYLAKAMKVYPKK